MNSGECEGCLLINRLKNSQLCLEKIFEWQKESARTRCLYCLRWSDVDIWRSYSTARRTQFFMALCSFIAAKSNGAFGCYARFILNKPLANKRPPSGKLWAQRWPYTGCWPLIHSSLHKLPLSPRRPIVYPIYFFYFFIYFCPIFLSNTPISSLKIISQFKFNGYVEGLVF